MNLQTYNEKQEPDSKGMYLRKADVLKMFTEVNQHIKEIERIASTMQFSSGTYGQHSSDITRRLDQIKRLIN